MPAQLVFKLKADYLKALAHPARLAVIEELKNGERSVGQLVSTLGVEQPTLSKHLAQLRQMGILASRQQSTTVFYSIRDRGIYTVLRSVTALLKKRLVEGQRVLERLGHG